MRKKLLKKINDTVESAPDFQSINKCVDYEKYEKKKGIKLSFISKPMIVASGVFLTLIVVGLGLFIDAKSVRDYNKLVKEHNDYIKSNQIYVGSGNLHKVDEKTLPQYVLEGYKESLIDKSVIYNSCSIHIRY